MKYLPFLFLLILYVSHCRPKEVNYITQFPGKPEIPASIMQEHEYLLDKIHQMTFFQDSTGRAAIKLHELMQHHFKEEEDYVLPPLGHLPLMASGLIPDQWKEVVLLTEKLKSQLPLMNAEHQMIKAIMTELLSAAATDGHPDIPDFEMELHKHATLEEEILFPTAILIGEYLKLKSSK